jgi:hypothetical protein
VATHHVASSTTHQTVMWRAIMGPCQIRQAPQQEHRSYEFEFEAGGLRAQGGAAGDSHRTGGNEDKRLLKCISRVVLEIATVRISTKGLVQWCMYHIAIKAEEKGVLSAYTFSACRARFRHTVGCAMGHN